MITPPSISPGDRIAIISPATEVKPFWVEGAVEQLEAFGYVPVVMPHALGCTCGTFAATDADRLADLRAALADPDIKAILCARGGYGCNHLLSTALETLVRENPKWIVGFSDISALHALWQKAGVKSIHASMAKQLTLFDIASRSAQIREAAAPETPSDAMEMEQIRLCTRIMLSIMEGYKDEVSLAADTPEWCIEGEACGEIAGGNLAVLNGLAATPWDILAPRYLRGKILFLEDVGEKIYQVERMLKRLQLAGVFEAVAGVVFGKFTDYRPDRNFPSMEAMIACRLTEWGVKCPVATGFPIGHVSFNLPVVEGATARLTVSAGVCRLSYQPQ